MSSVSENVSKPDNFGRLLLHNKIKREIHKDSDVDRIPWNWNGKSELRQDDSEMEDQPTDLSLPKQDNLSPQDHSGEIALNCEDLQRISETQADISMEGIDSMSQIQQLETEDNGSGKENQCKEECCPYLKKLVDLRRNVHRMLRVFTPYLGVGDITDYAEDSIDKFLHEAIYSKLDDDG